MNKRKNILFTAGIGLALAFTLSCSGDGGDPPPLGTGPNAVGSPVSYGGETYQTVVIGAQTWFARNLNYDPGIGNSSCYEGEPSNCATYGRLYDWATAMGLPSSCNSSACSGQVQTKHKGVCPSGWRIPNDADWDALMTSADGSSTAGAKLKAKSRWEDNGNGTDEYGFSALPGGYGYYSVGSFGSVGNSGHWWSATEGNDDYAYLRRMNYDYSAVDRGYDSKFYLFSVRCVQDHDEKSSSSAPSSSSSVPSSSSSAPSSSSSAPSSSSSIPSSSSSGGGGSSSSVGDGNVVYGHSIDYGNETYQTVIIGAQTWFARNLNYDPSTGNSSCYEGEPSNCITYGRLYDWATAMGLPSSCNKGSCSDQLQPKHQGICPIGWHIPSDAEWTTLTDFVGSSTAGTKLKATSGWNGTDDYGFSALPGGRGLSDGSFSNVSSTGFWWSATETTVSYAYYRYMNQIYSYVERDLYSKSYFFSVRCVRD